MKMMAGCSLAASRNSARTIFSASPCHLEVRLEALMLKKVARASCAKACTPYQEVAHLSHMAMLPSNKVAELGAKQAALVPTQDMHPQVRTAIGLPLLGM